MNVFVDKNAVELLMAKKQMTQKQLANVSGVSRYTLGLALRHKRSTKPPTIGKIATALGVEPEAIVKADN